MALQHNGWGGWWAGPLTYGTLLEPDASPDPEEYLAMPAPWARRVLPLPVWPFRVGHKAAEAVPKNTLNVGRYRIAVISRVTKLEILRGHCYTRTPTGPKGPTIGVVFNNIGVVFNNEPRADRGSPSTPTKVGP